MPRSTRLFEIIQLLRSTDDPMTARDIAERLEVTPRTVYRDMASLQAMRLPIEGEAGIGYVMRPGFDLPPLMFSPEEVEAIMVGLSLLGRTGDDHLQRAADQVVAKITDVLPQDRRTVPALQASDWHNIPESRIDPALLRTFIRDAAEIEITYVDRKERPSNRIILPLTLTYYIEALVVVAWCELRQDFRHFRIDRIEECRPTGRQFPNQQIRLLRQWDQLDLE